MQRRELARTGPDATFSRRVAAALPVLVPVVAPSTAAAWKAITMNKAVSLFLAVRGVGIAGYFVASALRPEQKAATPGAVAEGRLK